MLYWLQEPFDASLLVATVALEPASDFVKLFPNLRECQIVNWDPRLYLVSKGQNLLGSPHRRVSIHFFLKDWLQTVFLIGWKHANNLFDVFVPKLHFLLEYLILV